MSEFYTPQQPASSRPGKRFIITLSVVFLISVIGGAFGLAAYYRSERAGIVMDSLETIPGIMNQQTIGGSGYQQGLPEGILLDRTVSLSGGGSFDGTSYCFTATSKEDDSVVYHIDSSSKKPEKGSCNAQDDLPAPAAPLVLKATIVSGAYIGVEWQQVARATSYTIQCSTDQTFSKDTISTVTKVTNGSCGDLAPDQQYYIRVRANSTVAGKWSDSIVANTETVSVAPTDMAVKSVSSTQIEYSWSPVAGATSYVLERTTNPNFANDVVTLTLTTTKGISTDLKPSTTYFYRVKAITAVYDIDHAVFSQLGIATTTK